MNLTSRVKDFNEEQLLEMFLPIFEEHNQRVAQRLEKVHKPNPCILGAGDDSAIFSFNQGLTVMSIDTQTENQDFRTQWVSGHQSSGYDVGWKLVTQNIADIVAMRAVPQTLLISLSLPPQTPCQWLQDCAHGVVDALSHNEAQECTISGGDLGASTEISITVTAVGRCLGEPVRRNNARPADVIAVAGELGTAAAGLALLDSPEFLGVNNPELLDLVYTQKRPSTPLTLGLSAENAHSMMDISDGLIRDGQRIAKASKVSMDFSLHLLEKDLKKLLPAAQWLCQHTQKYATSTPEHLAKQWVLYGGENHSMLATFSSSEKLPQGFRAVGTCTIATSTPQLFINHEPATEYGWDHFS
ncbi:thiamine-phosphate kinase [Rothia sp. CCM 9418]|uniref:thiamine-phosphate kinase n=1 Tax=Rothia sp. CCM 9418 TaxID=3402661 RepID=UPI003ADA2A39